MRISSLTCPAWSNQNVRNRAYVVTSQTKGALLSPFRPRFGSLHLDIMKRAHLFAAFYRPCNDDGWKTFSVPPRSDRRIVVANHSSIAKTSRALRRPRLFLDKDLLRHAWQLFLRRFYFFSPRVPHCPRRRTVVQCRCWALKTTRRR